MCSLSHQLSRGENFAKIRLQLFESSRLLTDERTNVSDGITRSAWLGSVQKDSATDQCDYRVYRAVFDGGQ